MKISRQDPRYLSDDDGNTFIPIGHNICWPRWERDEEKVYALYEKRFQEMQKNGANYTRLWLSSEFFEPEYEFGRFDDSRGKRARQIQILAKKYGIKIKFTFCHYRQISTDNIEFPGSVTFGMPMWNICRGGIAETLAGYLVRPQGRKDFLDRVNFWKSHLENDETVFAWELWNEMNCVNASNETWHKWTEDMLVELRDIFPGSLVCQSMGGFDSEEKHAAYDPVWRMADNDLTQVHLYVNTAYPSYHVRGMPMDEMIHTTLNRTKTACSDRPLLMAEVGGISSRYAGPSDLYYSDPEGTLFHDAVFAPFFCGSAGTGQFWHWHCYIDRYDLYWHYARFNKAIAGIDPAGEHFIPIKLHDPQLNVYILKGVKNTLVWCRSRQSSWRSEILHGEPVRDVCGHKLNLSAYVNGDEKVSFYDSWTDETVAGSSGSGSLLLPDFKRSLVIRLEKPNNG